MEGLTAGCIISVNSHRVQTVNNTYMHNHYDKGHSTEEEVYIDRVHQLLLFSKTFTFTSTQATQ